MMITSGTRWLLRAFSGLTLLAFIVLFIGAEGTDHYFAWTIQPAATAAFLGAAYAAGCVLVVMGLRRRTWSVVRIPFLTVLVFVLLTLVATGLHLDKFHFGRDIALTRFAAWFWTAVYVVVPVVMVALLLRGPAGAVHRGTAELLVPIPRPVEVALAVQGVVFVVVGAVLFIAPRFEGVIWPWALTPLTARVVAAWLLAFGFGAVLALRDRNLARLDVAATAYAVLAVLELVVVARFPGVIRWQSFATWVFLVLLTSIAASSVFALWWLSRLRESRATGR